MTWLEVSMSSVYPSGAAFAAISVPMMPLAPARSSTTICWPHASVSLWPIRRDMMSGPDPGEVEAMMRIGRVGYCAAAAAPQAITVENAEIIVIKRQVTLGITVLLRHRDQRFRPR